MGRGKRGVLPFVPGAVFGLQGPREPARTKAGAIKRFRREYQYRGRCEAVPRQQTFDLRGGG